MSMWGSTPSQSHSRTLQIISPGHLQLFTVQILDVINDFFGINWLAFVVGGTYCGA